METVISGIGLSGLNVRKEHICDLLPSAFIYTSAPAPHSSLSKPAKTVNLFPVEQNVINKGSISASFTHVIIVTNYTNDSYQSLQRGPWWNILSS